MKKKITMNEFRQECKEAGAYDSDKDHYEKKLIRLEIMSKYSDYAGEEFILSNDVTRLLYKLTLK